MLVTIFLWLIIQLRMIIKHAPKILCVAHRKRRRSPIYEYFLLFYGRINMAVLNYIGRKSSHIPFTFTTRKFDWLFIVHPIWLVWHTYITHSLTHSLTHWPIDPSITYATRRLRGIFFFTKNNSKANFVVYRRKIRSLLTFVCSFFVLKFLHDFN